jgi:predicted  nucleic acid-binding Zn-ribbon protein
MATYYKQRFEKIVRDHDHYRSAYFKLLEKSADLQTEVDRLENELHKCRRGDNSRLKGF